MRNVLLQWLFTSGRPVHKFPAVSMCTTWSDTCESKVQGVVSLGRHSVLTNGTWHVLLQSGNVFELGGITRKIVSWDVALKSVINLHSKRNFQSLEAVTSLYLKLLTMAWVFNCVLYSAAGSVLYLFGGSNYPESEECLDGLYAYDVGKIKTLFFLVAVLCSFWSKYRLLQLAQPHI